MGFGLLDFRRAWQVIVMRDRIRLAGLLPAVQEGSEEARLEESNRMDSRETQVRKQEAAPGPKKGEISV